MDETIQKSLQKSKVVDSASELFVKLKQRESLINKLEVEIKLVWSA